MTTGKNREYRVIFFLRLYGNVYTVSKDLELRKKLLGVKFNFKKCCLHNIQNLSSNQPRRPPDRIVSANRTKVKGKFCRRGMSLFEKNIQYFSDFKYGQTKNVLVLWYCVLVRCGVVGSSNSTLFVAPRTNFDKVKRDATEKKSFKIPDRFVSVSRDDISWAFFTLSLG